jgi:hypothetical protein
MATVTSSVHGMSSTTRVGQGQSALEVIPSVLSAQADFAHPSASLISDGAVLVAQLQSPVAAPVYTSKPSPGRGPIRRAFAQPLVNGPLAALALLGLYLGLIALAQGWDHALEQFEIDRWFVLASAAGFGTQVGLFSYLRVLQAGTAAGKVGMAASTGTSTAAMLACCAHHVSELLPIIGVSGAAVFLGAYKAPLLWLGLVMNLGGIVYLLWQLRRLPPRLVMSGSFRQDA